MGGMASVIVFWIDRRVETVLVSNRTGRWEPPGGAIEERARPEETATAEAMAETGLEVELTGLASAGRVTVAFADENGLELPVATFVAAAWGGGRLRSGSNARATTTPA